ncbi:MAG: GNAT family N-acetyltransferase [Betaproteobacteria bacterium]|nr:MAG: GNAT family N-acetyltransferase [Betaproteobacteria bacterium]
MKPINVEIVNPEARAKLAEFLCENNRAPRLCLHSEAGETLSAYLADLAALPPDEAAYVAATIDDVIVGVMGAEFEPDGDRTWLRGPVIANELPSEAADGVCDALWRELADQLPATVKRFDGFPEIAHTALQAWYRRQQFTEQSHYFIYESPRPDPVLPWPDQVKPATAAQHAALIALAKFVFPTGYITEAQFTAANDERHAVFVIGDGDAVDGYVYANIPDAGDEPTEVYVDYLVVSPQARGKGYGRMLLQAALAWGFLERNAQSAALTVAADNTNAKGLYASVGFDLVATGVPMRRDVK